VYDRLIQWGKEQIQNISKKHLVLAGKTDFMLPGCCLEFTSKEQSSVAVLSDWKVLPEASFQL